MNVQVYFAKPILFFLILISCAVVLSACSVQVSPAPASASAILGPDWIASRKNPVTKQPVTNFLSQAQIKQNAKQQLDDLIQKHQWMGHAIMLPGSSDKRYSRLKKHFEKVRSASHLKRSNVFPVLIDAPPFQALTFGGEEVVFYTGLSEALKDDALAFVIAHELAHIASQHVSEARSLSVTNIQANAQSPRQNDLYSYGHEREADTIGLVYLLLAGYDAGPAQDLWQELAKSQPNSPYDLFSATHPATHDRARFLTENTRLFRQNLQAFDQSNLLNCNPLYCDSDIGALFEKGS